MALISEDRAVRIEDKLDRLTETVQKLVLIDERQIEQGKRLGRIEEDASKTNLAVLELRREVDKWKYIGFGVWLVVSVMFTGWQVFKG